MREVSAVVDAEVKSGAEARRLGRSWDKNVPATQANGNQNVLGNLHGLPYGERLRG